MTASTPRLPREIVHKQHWRLPDACRRAGIEGYWRVELDPIEVTAHVLRGDAYVELGTWSTGAIAKLCEPFVVSIDVSVLVPPA